MLELKNAAFEMKNLDGLQNRLQKKGSVKKNP